jgi:hypothetical protein
LVSVPERALLELLSDVGKKQSLEEARQLVETLRTLREKTLDELLTHTTKIKVFRLADLLANDLQQLSDGLFSEHDVVSSAQLLGRPGAGRFPRNVYDRAVFFSDGLLLG